MIIRRLVHIFSLTGMLCSHCFAQHTASITILHYNDYHAQYLPLKLSTTDSSGKPGRYEAGGAAAFKAYLDLLSKSDTNVLILNAGDNFQGTPVSSLTRGKADIMVMNLLAPDVTTLGNHEFDYSVDTLRNRLLQLHVPVVSANLWDIKKRKSFVPPTIIKTVGNVKIGIIGLAPPDLVQLTMRENIRGLKILDLFKTVEQAIHQLRSEDKVDLIIVLSHVGVEVDSVLASKEKAIDVIIGGHSHTPLFVPKRVNHTVICQAGANSRYLGELRLQVDLDGDSLLSYSGRLVETVNGVLPADQRVATVVDSLEEIVSSTLNQVIGTLAVRWKRKYNQESNIGNWHADAMRRFGKTDIALLNSGSLRKDMDSGAIRIRDIWEINPFGNELATFTVDGAQLKRMIEWQLSDKQDLVQISGLTYTFDSKRPEGHRFISALVNKKSIDPHREYSITVNSFTAGHLHDIFGLPESRITIHDLRTIDRDVFIREVERQKVVSSIVEGRIINIGREHFR